MPPWGSAPLSSSGNAKDGGAGSTSPSGTACSPSSRGGGPSTSPRGASPSAPAPHRRSWRSEEHTSELQSRPHLVCRLLLEKKKTHHVRARYLFGGAHGIVRTTATVPHAWLQSRPCVRSLEPRGRSYLGRLRTSAPDPGQLP